MPVALREELLPIFFLYIAVTTVALVAIRRSALSDVARAVWTLTVLLVPFLGPLAFFVVNAGRRRE
ncbi:MAG: PLDc N-terminal domain-containing protein [Roseiflexus sp.]|nr:PLDc N-terminal domain-containing protein [Roseiflexus sp.]MDW8148442.1 PLDc N-terminal domain-containing protein [Roseiflexaceae bacterium]